MNSDFEYVKKKLEEAPAALPASLQPDEVVRRLREETAENSEAPEGTGTNEPETKPKKGVIRRLLPLVAVAAAVALLVGLLPRVTRNKPADTDRACSPASVCATRATASGTGVSVLRSCSCRAGRRRGCRPPCCPSADSRASSRSGM